jgi:hypothetical protein
MINNPRGEKAWGDPDSTEERELLDSYDTVLVVQTESYGIAREMDRALGRTRWSLASRRSAAVNRHSPSLDGWQFIRRAPA